MTNLHKKDLMKINPQQFLQILINNKELANDNI